MSAVKFESKFLIPSASEVEELSWKIGATLVPNYRKVCDLEEAARVLDAVRYFYESALERLHPLGTRNYFPGPITEERARQYLEVTDELNHYDRVIWLFEKIVEHHRLHNSEY